MKKQNTSASAKRRPVVNAGGSHIIIGALIWCTRGHMTLGTRPYKPAVSRLT